ncbi:M24 family metallopeptidase [Haloarcula pellucida]|uniref:Peptidase M24 n=1 Tax=Haloarcula pellucida TaxID=1427151 RepID=A0A830GKJ6_9EURY|nr:Xaa-Pro peptidase family protein [Halomicroarcula pellucida]MBX0347769.1 Xaa-Pro peptidase family protein [Halomicroarcula pellucida]GGN90209.1 peptidase M24 [Halomicroarcula pellucida]
MDPDLSALDEYLDETDTDGYLLDADSEDSDQYYLSGFDAPDPFITLYDGETHLLFPRSLEFGRAKRESRAESVQRYVDFDHAELVDEYGPEEAVSYVLAAFLSSYDVDSVAVPPRFPLKTADGLRARGVSVTADTDGVVTEIRATKTDEEVDHVRAAQRANEAAMAAAEDLLADATVDDDGTLTHDGETLTSERVKEEIEVTLLRHGCSLDETIVACGADAADPHDRGSGPLTADEPIIVDIFPQDKSTKYHADMTRTVCKGTPSDTVEEWYDLTERAMDAAFDALEPGATGEDVHAAVCDVYEDAGHPTLRSDDRTETGFIHSTGHGVGLDVHELPRLSPNGGDLEPGHVVTIEPGLYDPEVGGIRIEDIAVVTEDGYENLTEYEKRLVV